MPFLRNYLPTLFVDLNIKTGEIANVLADEKAWSGGEKVMKR